MKENLTASLKDNLLKQWHVSKTRFAADLKKAWDHFIQIAQPVINRLLEEGARPFLMAKMIQDVTEGFGDVDPRGRLVPAHRVTAMTAMTESLRLAAFELQLRQAVSEEDVMGILDQIEAIKTPKQLEIALLILQRDNDIHNYLLNKYGPKELNYISKKFRLLKKDKMKEIRDGLLTAVPQIYHSESLVKDKLNLDENNQSLVSLPSFSPEEFKKFFQETGKPKSV